MFSQEDRPLRLRAAAAGPGLHGHGQREDPAQHGLFWGRCWGDLMGFYWNLMGFSGIYSDLMGFNWILLEFNGVL